MILFSCKYNSFSPGGGLALSLVLKVRVIGPIRHFHISHNAPYLPPPPQKKKKKKIAQALFSISLGTDVIHRRNEKQRLCKILRVK